MEDYVYSGSLEKHGIYLEFTLQLGDFVLGCCELLVEVTSLCQQLLHLIRKNPGPTAPLGLVNLLTSFSSSAILPESAEGTVDFLTDPLPWPF